MTRNLYSVDLNLLVALEALLLEGSVTRAANRVGITQSAMSNTLSRLRRVMEDEILIRVGPSWEVTPRAAALREPLERFLQIARDEIFSSRPYDPSTSERQFRIATANSSAAVILAPLMREISQLAPKTAIQIVPVGELTNDVLDRADLDLVLLPSTYGLRHPNVRLLTIEWTCVVDPAHPEAGNGALSADAFSRYRHVVYEHEGITTNAYSALSAAGLSYEASVVVDDFVLIPFLIQGSNFIGLLQDAFVRRLPPLIPLTTILPPIPLPPVHIHMYWSNRNANDPGLLWLRQQLVRVSEQSGHK